MNKNRYILRTRFLFEMYIFSSMNKNRLWSKISRILETADWCPHGRDLSYFKVILAISRQWKMIDPMYINKSNINVFVLFSLSPK